MRDTYVVSGTLTDGRTVTLDEGLPLGSTRMRVTVEPLPSLPARPVPRSGRRDPRPAGAARAPAAEPDPARLPDRS